MITSILKIPVSSTNYIKATKKIRDIIINNKKVYICVAAVHLIMECQTDKKLLKGVQSADIITPDGMPLVWLSRLYGNKKTSRVYGPDLTLVLCKLAEHFNYKVFFLGGSPAQSEQVMKRMISKFPKLKVVGNIDTPIRPIPVIDNQKIIKTINKSKADIVFIGLGCPTQELWMINNRSKLNIPILIGVGAAFDFITGKVNQAPLWTQNLGLEWLYRLKQEPRRLFNRYCILNTLFISKITKQIVVDLINGKL